MSNARELVSSAVQLVSLPDVYFRVKSLVDDPRSAMADIAQVIAYDPALSARFLKIANSAIFGFASKIETVSRAITLLGTQQVHDIVLATSVTRAFKGISSRVMNMEAFWRNSIYCGMLSRQLAIRCNVLDSERLFVEGLLRDIGHLILYQKVPELAEEALRRSRQEGKPLFRLERELLGFDYADVGGELLRSWKLPTSLQEAVRYHTEPSRAREFPLEASIVHIADLIATPAGANEDADQLTLRVDPVAWRATGLSEESIDAVRQEVDQQVAEALDLFLPKRKPLPTRPRARLR